MALYCAFALACTEETALAQVKHELAGARLIEQGSTCAGWKFSNEATAARYDEVACRRGDWPSLEARIHWVNPKQFALVETNASEPAPERPPRVWLFTIELLSAKRVQLREAWTGWGPGPDSVSVFRRK